MSLRPSTCQRPVIPGVDSSRRPAQPVICSDSWTTNGRGPTSDISPRSDVPQLRQLVEAATCAGTRRPGDARVGLAILNSGPALHLVQVGHARSAGASAPSTIERNLTILNALPAAAVADLAEEDGAAAVELDRDRRDEQHGLTASRPSSEAARSIARLRVRDAAREAHRRQADHRDALRGPRSSRWTRTARSRSGRSRGGRRGGGRARTMSSISLVVVVRCRRPRGRPSRSRACR